MSFKRVIALMLFILMIFTASFGMIACNGGDGPDEQGGGASSGGGGNEGGEGGGSSSGGEVNEGGGNEGGEGNEGAGNGSVNPAITYEQYLKMTSAEKYNYYLSFINKDDFFAWYNKAKREYEESQNRTEIGGNGSVDL